MKYFLSKAIAVLVTFSTVAFTCESHAGFCDWLDPFFKTEKVPWNALTQTADLVGETVVIKIINPDRRRWDGPLARTPVLGWLDYNLDFPKRKSPMSKKIRFFEKVSGQRISGYQSHGDFTGTVLSHTQLGTLLISADKDGVHYTFLQSDGGGLSVYHNKLSYFEFGSASVGDQAYFRIYSDTVRQSPAEVSAQLPPLQQLVPGLFSTLFPSPK